MNHDKIELDGPEPLYKQVEQRILRCLADGEWKPGDQLPAEQQIAERFGVAVFTLRAGISELVKSGLLLRKQGKGTFVARHTRQRQRWQFSHVYDRNGEQVQPVRNLVSFERGTASQREAQALGIAEDAAVIHFGVMLTARGRTFATMDVAVPARMFGSLSAQALRD